MDEVRVIAEFAWRQFRNELRTVSRSRLRIVMWIVSAIAFVGFIAVRIVALNVSHAKAPPFDARTAAMYGGVYLVYMAIAFILALTPSAQFASMAEGLLVGSSALRPRTVFIWLQLRALGRTLVRSFIVLVILATTGSANGVESARMTVLGFALILIPPSFAFHITIASPLRRNLVRVFGILLFALGIAVGFDTIPQSGFVMLAQARGAWWPTALGLAIAAIGVVTPPMRDPIPELFAATRPGGVRAQRLAENRQRKKNKDGGKTSDWMFDLGGVWVILSGRLATFFRIRKPLFFALGLLAWFAVGIGVGGAGRVFGPVADAVVLAAIFPLLLVICILAASVGRDFGIEIRNPLWWAGDAAMAPRLGVDSIASVWRFIVTAFAVLAGYAALGHLQNAAEVFALVTALIWLARCCGYLLFAFFPAAIDQHGALAGLRIFILFALAIPVGIVAVSTGVFGLHPLFALALTLSTALLQAVLLLRIAARRIDGCIEAYLVAT